MENPEVVGSEVVEVAEMARRGAVDAFLERVITILTGIIRFDLAVFLESSGNEMLKVRRAGGPLASEALHEHQVSLDPHPSLKSVMEHRAPVLFRIEDPEETPLFEDRVQLPDDHSCLLVPVFDGAGDGGLLVLIAEDHDVYDEDAIHLGLAYGQLIGLGLASARQMRQLERYKERLEEQNRLLVEEVASDTDACRALERSVSRPMRRLTEMARQVAITDAPVLITGETGTGKEVLSRAIHAWSRRSDKPFIQVNCAALPESLVESELFGHRKGAFSGATADRQGRFRVADGGTILLDEIGDLPAATQVNLLRVLQEGTLEPVGSDRTLTVDVRVLAATHVDLEKALDAGTFREDLYYRLNVFPMQVPSLRDRVEDIPELTRHILERMERRTGRGPWSIDEKTIGRMQDYPWPGNVRELVNVMERAQVFSPMGGVLKIDLPSARRRGRAANQEWVSLDEHMKRYIERVLERTQGKIYGDGGAAELLGLPPTTLQSRMRRLGVKRSSG